MRAFQTSPAVKCAVAAALAALSVTVPALGQAPRRFELADLAKLVRVSDPQFSPDGKTVVIVVSRPNFVDNRHDSELVLVDVASGRQRVLTRQRQGVSHPRWSPGGDQLAFLARAGLEKEGRTQLFLLPMNGGDPVQLTRGPKNVEHFVWKPDGAEIALAMADTARSSEKYNQSFDVGNSHYLATEASTSSHIWVVRASGGEPRRLTSGAWSLPVSPPAGPPASPLDWSPDGRWITFTQQKSSSYRDVDSRGIYALDVAGGRIRPIAGPTPSGGYPMFSPDGSRIAYLSLRDTAGASIKELFVAPAQGGGGANLSRSLDRQIHRATWLPDGRGLLIGGNDSLRTALWIQPLTGPAQRLNLGDISPSWSFWVQTAVSPDGAVAFAGSEPGRPTELYYLASIDDKPRRLTDFHKEIAGLALGNVQAFQWGGPDGLRHNGAVTYPPDFDPTRRYPLVLIIHGGPQAASKVTFSGQAQLFAARGYVVFEPNYRGSDNMGAAYQRAIVNDAGEGPGKDVMAGLAALTKGGFVDTSRVAVTGWSYGGFMTSWLIAHYSGWKAAVAGAAVTDWLDEHAMADAGWLAERMLGGMPWTRESAARYRKNSPITFVDKINTPTLVLATTGDARVPVSQSFKLYRALLDRGVPTQFIAYPLAGHFPADPVNARDVTRRWLEWVERHLTRVDAAAARSPL